MRHTVNTLILCSGPVWPAGMPPQPSTSRPGKSDKKWISRRNGRFFALRDSFKNYLCTSCRKFNKGRTIPIFVYLFLVVSCADGRCGLGAERHLDHSRHQRPVPAGLRARGGGGGATRQAGSPPCLPRRGLRRSRSHRNRLPAGARWISHFLEELMFLRLCCLVIAQASPSQSSQVPTCDIPPLPGWRPDPRSVGESVRDCSEQLPAVPAAGVTEVWCSTLHRTAAGRLRILPVRVRLLSPL